MSARFLSLLLVPLVAWLSAAGAVQRAHQPESDTCEAAVARPAKPIRVVDLRSLLRALVTRSVDRRRAPPEHRPTVAFHQADSCAAPRCPVRQGAEQASSESGTRELTFPYDATAPPARS